MSTLSARAHALARALVPFVLAVAGHSAGVAQAGTIAVASCRLPDGGPAPTEGWASGWTGTPLPYAGSANTCGSPGGSLSSYIGAQTAQPSSTGPFWEYTPPEGFTLIGGQVSASFDVPGSTNPSFTAATGMLGPKLQFDQADIIGGLPGGVSGTQEGTYPLAGHTGGHIWLYAFCEPPNSTCPANASNAWYWSTYSMTTATMLLSNETAPAASGFSGPVSEPGALSGTEELSFQASDNASGVYAVTATLDGQPIYTATLNTNNGQCVSLGSYQGAQEFTSASPCKQSTSVTIPLDTTQVKDGRHQLSIIVTDAAGNETTVYTHQIQTDNAPTVNERPTITGTASIGATLTATNATFTAPPGAGPLTATTGQWLRCADTEATHCTPIPTANSHTYSPTPSDAGYHLVYANSTADNDGTTTSDSEPTTTINPTNTNTSTSPGTTSGNTTHANTTLLGSPAKWKLTIKGSPLIVQQHTVLKLTGRVLTSPRPPAGKLIYIQARTIWHTRTHTHYSAWITFATPRTEKNGYWSIEHIFQFGGEHTYQMRAIAPQEGAYQNTTGTTTPITIHETQQPNRARGFWDLNAGGEERRRPCENAFTGRSVGGGDQGSQANGSPQVLPISLMSGGTGHSCLGCLDCAV